MTMSRTAAPLKRCCFALAVTVVVAIYFIASWMPAYYLKPWSTDVGGGMGFAINSGSRFATASLFIVISTILNGFVMGMTNRWIAFYVKNPNSPRDNIISSTLTIQLTVQVYNIYVALAALVNVFFAFTNIYLFSLKQLANIAVTYKLTNDYLDDKTRAERPLGVQERPETSLMKLVGGSADGFMIKI